MSQTAQTAHCAMQWSVPVDDELEVESAAEGQCKHYHPGLSQR